MDKGAVTRKCLCCVHGHLSLCLSGWLIQLLKINGFEGLKTCAMTKRAARKKQGAGSSQLFREGTIPGQSLRQLHVQNTIKGCQTRKQRHCDKACRLKAGKLRRW
jgi:hypothetical protein